MTTLKINHVQAEVEKPKHKLANWYVRAGELYLLAMVEGKAVLISLETGGWFSTPVPVDNPKDLSDLEWVKVTAGRTEAFEYVDEITIKAGTK